MIDYALNYEKIVDELCENRTEPELLCNGFCYLKKEVNKTEQTQKENRFVKNQVKILDAIVPIKQFISTKKYFTNENNSHLDYYQAINSEHIIRLVFHPPIV